ncbi:hypothetical protein PV326_006299 [Microctonus aethiopoides]|nr:hypothetical protein PV326_006299 [Microctonus aethiopoides]
MGAKNCRSYSPKEEKPNKNEPTPISCKQAKPEYIEEIVCNENEIKENEMKLVTLGDEGGKVLLIKQKGEYHAIGTKCTHYGALLNTGALGDGRVRCPWHGACFNIKTGDIEDYPGLDSLPCYKVTVSEGAVKVRARRSDLQANKRIKVFTGCTAQNNQTVIIVGGGPAGATCADTLRQEGFCGRIVMVCKEPVLPYERIKVSKSFDFDIEKALLRSQVYYDERKIETKLNVEATQLDITNNTVKLSNGEELKYNYMFLATGSKPREPNVPGSNLKNIFVVRNYSDGVEINKQLSSEKHVVILGQSFIGMEAAATCVGKCSSITVVGRDRIPLSAIFGDDIGDRIRKEHESKGVKFIYDTNITKFIARDNGEVVGQVELADGTILPADIVIAGIGSVPYTDWLKETSLEIKDNGVIPVNEYLKTNVENIYAGGDIAYAPVFVSHDNSSAAIGHYPLAHYHGRIAALNICGKQTPLRSVPYFWTFLFGKSYRYAGYGRASDIKIYGSLDELKFFAYYIKDGKVIAMSSAGTDPIVSDFAEYIHEGKTLTQEEIERDPIAWIRNKPVNVLKSIFPEKFDSVTES